MAADLLLAEFCIDGHIFLQVIMHGLKLQAHAPTNHHRVMIGSSSFLNFSLAISS